MSEVATALSSAARLRPMRGAASTADTNLRAEVERASRTLGELVRHQELLGAEVTALITRTVADVRQRLARTELSVVVVGEKKAGKSTFLNAILGARVLGTAVRECTGTVTFIRRAPRPHYRATLGGGGVIEFQDLEAPERATNARDIAALRATLGWHADRLIARSAPGDPVVAVEMANLEHSGTRQRLTTAETAEGECDRRRGAAAREVQRVNTTWQVEQGVLGELQARRIEQTAAEETEARGLAAALRALKDYGDRHALVIPDSVEARHQVAAAQNLAAAEGRLAIAASEMPFFLLPAPWWAFWIHGLRFALGWCFVARVKVLGAARRQHRHAVMFVGAVDASARLDWWQRDAAETIRRLSAAQRSVESAGQLHRAAQGQLGSAEQELQRARAVVAEARQAEAVARLRLLLAKSDALDGSFLARFRSEVHSLTDMEKRGKDVVELAIGFPAVHLPDGITIIDTPGVNTDNAANRERAWAVIRREADGCLLVSDLKQVVSHSTREFLQEVRPIIPHILLVMSKVDEALANAEGVGDLAPVQQVEEARRTGVRRFAREVGRSTDDVFSIAVAAEPALRGDASPDGLGQRFPVEVAKVFDLLQAERAVVLGARAASALREGVQRIGEAQVQAEAKYNLRIAELERHRLPDPRDFQTRQLAKVEGALVAHADGIGRSAQAVMASGVDAVEAQWVTAIRSCSTKDEVKATVARLGQQGQGAMNSVMSHVERDVSAKSAMAIKQLEGPLLEDLRARYRIVQQLTGSGVAVQLGAVAGATSATYAADLHSGVNSAVENFENAQLAFGAGGAVYGAVLGTIVFPGIGTAIGAALGALFGLFKTLDSLKNDCVTAVQKGLGEAKLNLSSQLASVGPDVQRAMKASLVSGLGDAVSRYQAWIQQVMATERAQIDQERQKLAHLIASRDALVRHDQALAALHREAAAASRGLCG